MSAEFRPADTSDQCNPPSTVNSSEVGVLMRPCCRSEKEICKIVSLIPERGTHVSPPSTIWCFTCQCAPLSDETAIVSSVPQIHNRLPTLDMFSTRNEKS